MHSQYVIIGVNRKKDRYVMKQCFVSNTDPCSVRKENLFGINVKQIMAVWEWEHVVWQEHTLNFYLNLNLEFNRLFHIPPLWLAPEGPMTRVVE